MGLIEKLRIIDYFSDELMEHRTISDQELIERLRKERKEAADKIEILHEALTESYEKLKIECSGHREYKGGMPTQVLFPMIEKALG